MIGTPLWWGVQFGLSFLDFVMIYVIAHVTVRRHITVKPLHVLFAIVYILALAPVFYLWGGHIFRLVAFMCKVLIIKMATKRRSPVDLAIIFAICSALMIVTPLPAIALVWLANTQLMLEFPLDFLIGHSITAALVLLMCRKFKLNQWFSAVQRNIVLKLVLLAIILIFLIIVSILNFEYDVIFLLVSAGALIAIGLPLWPVLMNIYHNALGMISVHDLKNSLLALSFEMQEIDDFDVFKERFKRLSKNFGMDLSRSEDLDIKHKKDQEFEERMIKHVKDFIETKVKSREKDVNFLTEISYFKHYESVDFGLILQWIGALLDNAIDATDTKPIYIYANISKTFIDIRMANEYVGDKGQDIRVILEQGYSTKGEGRGIGLHNLNQQVTERGGTVRVEDYYVEEHNCHYLQIVVLFDNYGKHSQ